jgi:CBS domain containing-hemolysin-like protein
LLAGIGLLLIILLVTTANMSIRHFSRVLLSERLEKKGKLDLLNRLIEVREELMFSLSTVRMSAILALVLLIAYWFNADWASKLDITQSDLIVEYITIFLVSIALIVVFGVAIPSAWSRYGGEFFLGACLRPLLGLRYVLYPLNAFQKLMDIIVRRLAGIPPIDEQRNEAMQIEKEILGAVSEGELAGAVHEEDADMIESVMEFRNTEVGEIMTPRTEMIALSQHTALDDAKKKVIEAGHSRIPIYGENIDEVRGVLYAKDLLRVDQEEGFDPVKIMRKVPFVPETKRVADLLKEMRELKVHLAIVLDEYGGTAGLVTIEDILEEIVGEIADEYEPAEPEPIQRIDDQTLEVDARLHIDELNDELKIELPEDEDYDTVGGFVFSKMGKIPTTGEEFYFENVRIRVIDAEERKINRLRVQVQADQPAA